MESPHRKIELVKTNGYNDLKNNKECNERINKIYGLIDPRDNRLFYIGCSVVPMYKRLSQHMIEAQTIHKKKREILHEIIEGGLFPIIHIFYKINDRYTARIIEKHITNFVITNNFNTDLVNFAGSTSNITTNVNLKK
jgi:hypothetical protein